ncbi:uncharacterized protein SCHCODRAFT_02667573 [Schizophyllum commune H4-8]|nr:uncharacterized protein SCHCODRAFT_02667573 [Schizophyllum commune H4-8]KAI5892028.1 hypothetical protein SCHCODRAFT_02667573 [Schizophyllum commune H4-8]
MAPLTARKLHQRLASALGHDHFLAGLKDSVERVHAAGSENIDPALLAAHTRRCDSRCARCRDEIATLKADLNDLLGQNSALLDEVASLHATMSETTQSLIAKTDRVKDLERKNRRLTKKNRSLTDDVTAADKRTQRVKRSKRSAADGHEAQLSALRTKLDDELTAHAADVAGLEAQLANITHQLEIAISSRNRLRGAAAAHRRDKSIMRKQIKRLLVTLRKVRTVLHDLQEKLVFTPKKGHQYSPTSRWLGRQLMRYGVKPHWLDSAVKDVAFAFGIRIKGRFLSRRTAGAVKLELGMWSLLQLGKEIKDCMAFVCSSDGTSHKKIQYESTCISLRAPTYEPDVNDEDPSTWKPVTRFVALTSALRHTAEAQQEGKRKLGEKIAEIYNSSPLAQADGKMDGDEWLIKQVGQNKDHAADGRKETTATGEAKEKAVTRRLEEEEAANIDFQMLLRRVMSLTQQEMRAAVGEDRALSDIGYDERCQIALSLLKSKLGHDMYLRLHADRSRQAFLTMFIFGGCGAHKDLNAFKYGTDAISKLWKSKTLASPQPILLPNKAFDAVINLPHAGDSEAPSSSDARLLALSASASGGVKCAAIWGAIFRNKDDKKGYQEHGRTLVHSFKTELHGSAFISSANIADTNNTRYQSHGKTAIELVTYDHEYRSTIETICQGKTNGGQPNHMEALALRALDFRQPGWTLSLWAHKHGEPRNLLDTVKLHRRIPSFCDELGDHPERLFDESTSYKHQTLFGAPLTDRQFFAKARLLRGELGDDVLRVISAMFHGAADGWRQFTAEFAPDGPIDRLSADQRRMLFIPATNDHNEGALGSWRLYIRHNPCSTPATFSALERANRNDSEAFITKVYTEALETFVMQSARIQGASGEMKKFKQALAAQSREKAAAQDRKRKQAEKRSKQRRQHLESVGLEMREDSVRHMGVKALREQLELYRDVVGDLVTKKLKWSLELKGKDNMLAQTLAALSRYKLSDGEAESGAAESPEAQQACPEAMDVDPVQEGGLVSEDECMGEDEEDLMDTDFF